MTLEMGQVCLNDVLITEELSRRSPRTPDLKAENDALRKLARQLVEHPQTILKTLVTIAKDLCQAGTAGVSLLETMPNGEEVFRWAAIAGQLERYEQGTAPRHFSPCGVCLERQSPQLYSYPARYFNASQPIEPLVVEGLLIPLMTANQPLGAIWVVSHDSQRQFDAEDVRLMSSLGDFTAAALCNKRIEQTLRQSEERLRIAQQAAKAGVWDWDILTNQVTWSEEYYRLYGLDSTIVRPSYANWLTLIVEQDRDRVDRATREALEHQTNLNVEFRIVHPTQGERWIMVIGQTFYAAQQPIRMTGIALDITDRKQAEAELRESEARFRHMADTAPVLIWMSGTDKLCHYFNQPWLDFTGRTMEQEMGNGWAEGVHPDDFQRCLETYVTAFDARQPFRMEYRLRRFDGVYRWIVDEAVPRFTAAGNFLGYIGTCIDIEDLKQTEAALAQSETQLRLMIESAKDYAIFTLDMDDHITHWNSGAQRLLGYQESEILGQSGRIIFTPEDLEQGEADREVQKAFSNGRAENERWHVRKNGSRFWGSGLMMPLRDEDNQIQGFLKILQDKTAQRQADERLHLLYETTSNLLAAKQPMMLINNLFNKLSAQLELHCYYNFMVEEQDNRSRLHLRNYSGISEKAAQALEWIEFGDYLCGLVAQEQHPIILDRAQIASYPEAQLVRNMGITAYAGYPLVAQGRLLGTLAFASLTRTCFTPEESNLLQVTCAQVAIAIERANLIASLQQQAEQLQQANRIKDEFLAVLSHELRSPLNPILGWARILQGRKLSEAKTAEALATIERNARLQAELIEDLLDVSRILQGKLSLNMVPVDLISTIQAAMETMRLAAEAKTIQIQTRLEPAIGKILGDPARIQQVLWNLLSNAVKFTPPGGQVTICLEQVEGGEETPSLSSSPAFYAQIIVTDTGNGISPDFLPYVFDYFRQADSATTRKFGGLGLGLAIVRHLVELHGGTIQAESQGEGLGATFTIRLPLLPTRPKADQDKTAPELPLDLSGVKILVVDDDTDTREFVAFLLEHTGATVTAAASASEGFAALTQSKLDLLLSDIGMPDRDGYMLLQQVRNLPPEQGGNIPAIALTAYAGEIDYQQAMAAGFQRHVPKPVEPEELVKAIVDLVQPARRPS